MNGKSQFEGVVVRESLWAGLDTGAETSRLCVINGELAPVLDATLNSTAEEIIAALAPSRAHIVEIAAEATSSSIPLARGLRDAGYRVILYEAWQVSRYLRVRRNKTDNNDARGLAELAKLQLPSMRPVYLKSLEAQRLRAKLQFRHKLLRQRLTCENMMRSLIRLHGGGKVKPGHVAWTVERNVRAALDTVRGETGIDLSDDVLPLLDLAVAIRHFVERLDKDFVALARAHPVCSRFLQIPGVGPICAISFYTAVEDPFRFAHAADIGPYLGLTPKVRQSGTSRRHGHISKLGNLLTRSHLVMAATILMQDKMDDMPLKAWALSLAERAGSGKARVALARRLAVIMLAMWKNGSEFDEMLPSPHRDG